MRETRTIKHTFAYFCYSLLDIKTHQNNENDVEQQHLFPCNCYAILMTLKNNEISFLCSSHTSKLFFLMTNHIFIWLHSHTCYIYYFIMIVIDMRVSKYVHRAKKLCHMR